MVIKCSIDHIVKNQIQTRPKIRTPESVKNIAEKNEIEQIRSQYDLLTTATTITRPFSGKAERWSIISETEET